MLNLPHCVNFDFFRKNLILKGAIDPLEPELAAEAREARRSGKWIQISQVSPISQKSLVGALIKKRKFLHG